MRPNLPVMRYQLPKQSVITLNLNQGSKDIWRWVLLPGVDGSDDVRTMLLMICRLDCLHRLTTSKYESNGIVRSAVGGRCAGGKYMTISSDRLPMQTNYRGTLCEER